MIFFMLFDFTFLVSLFVFILPAYVANSVPVIFGGGVPLDFNRNFSDGRRIFGEGKTLRGFASGVLLGTLFGFLLSPNTRLFGLSPQGFLTVSFLLSFGALTGDAAGSFVKRRVGLSHGQQYLFVDQLFFLLFALLFAFAFKPELLSEIGVLGVVVLTLFTLVLHVSFNLLAHKYKFKKVPW
ncbi:MAG: CDP-2,3-bis-(O-geranylgeranyl)-sn-glycerol synthase [Candidatus Micrarchaeia archaeon]